MMKWIEIIRLRLLDHLKQTTVIELLHQIAADASAPDVTCTLYHHATVETDLSIHLAWNSDILQQGKSALGAKLTYMLREFGLMDYSVWIELWSL